MLHRITQCNNIYPASTSGDVSSLMKLREYYLTSARACRLPYNIVAIAYTPSLSPVCLQTHKLSLILSSSKSHDGFRGFQQRVIGIAVEGVSRARELQRCIRRAVIERTLAVQTTSPPPRIIPSLPHPSLGLSNLLTFPLHLSPVRQLPHSL